jgi:hypothetical protein
MDRHTDQQLKWLERRSRLLTGTILAVLALAACYGWLFFGGQVNISAQQHFYAWMVAVLFYFAGDLLAFVWFKVVCIRLEMLLDDFKQSLRRQLVAEEAEEETLSAADVEIVRPTEHRS